MSSREAAEREIEELRGELAQLTIRVDRLAAQLVEADFEVVSEPCASTSSAGQSYGGVPRLHCQEEREEVAREIGLFFKRCLQGLPRGESGRSRIRLQNRFYVICRTYEEVVHTRPVIVLEKYAQVKKLVCHRDADAFGNSVFCGFPSIWEAKLAVASAGFQWPK